MGTERTAVPPGRRRARWLALLLGVLLAALAGELGLRWLLFSDAETARVIGRPLRHPALFAAPGSDDEWKLQHAFLPSDERGAHEHADPVLGWRSELFDADGRHVAEERIGARRPVLLFGDSYARCATGPEACFEGLLEESRLGATHALLNYGGAGYGLDQIVLAIEKPLARLRPRDPVVVVGIFVDDDLQRTALSFRNWPKPRFGVADGRLLAPPPVETDPVLFLAREPPGIASYLLALPLRRLEASAGDEPIWREAHTRELDIALLAELDRRLVASGVEHFYFLFCGETTLALGPEGSFGEQLVLEFLRTRPPPERRWISTRGFLEHAAARDPRGLARFFGTNGRLRGHHNAAGNRVAMVALLQGLEGRFDDVDHAALEALAASGVLARGSRDVRPFELLGRRAELASDRPPAIRVEWNGARTEAVRVLLRAPAAGSTELGFELEPAARTFRARLRWLGEWPEDGESPVVQDGQARARPLEPDAGEPSDSAHGARLEIRADGGLRTVFRAWDEAASIEVDCTQVGRFELLLRGGDLAGGDRWIALEGPRFE